MEQNANVHISLKRRLAVYAFRFSLHNYLKYDIIQFFSSLNDIILE